MQYTSNAYFSYPQIDPYCHLRSSCISIWHMGHTGNICLDWQLEAKFDKSEISNGETSLHGL